MRTHEQATPPCFIELAAAVPPTLEQVIGYPLPPPPDGPHYLGLCWMRAGDEAWFEDGRLGSCANPWGYLAWVRHAAVGPYLPPDGSIDLGSGDTEATHMLVLDRAARRVWVAAAEAARAFLKGQWGPLDPRDAAAVERVRLDVEAFARKPAEALAAMCGLGGVPTPEEARRIRAREQQAVVEMARWLDGTDQARAARARIRHAAAAVAWDRPSNPNEDADDFFKCETDA